MLEILLFLGALLLYLWLRSTYDYWKKRGVPGPRPLPLLGNVGKVLTLKSSVGEIFTDIYNQYKDQPMVGVYRTTTPVLLLRDPELIKEVTVKSFGHFQDNEFYIDRKADPLFGRNVFALKGEEWKLARSYLTPGFSSSKMKAVYPILENSAQKMISFIDNHPDGRNNGGYDIKELTTKFTLNNASNAAFGLESNCFDDENSAFRQLARDYFSPGSWSSYAFTLTFLMPSVSKLLGLRFVTEKVEARLTKIISETLEYRDKNNILRNDFLQVMSQLKKTSKLADIDVIAQAATFFFEGYEASSVALSFVLFEVARNPEAQRKLRAELDDVFNKNDNTIPYETIQTLPYLDGVINEAFRFHPAFLCLQKLCTKTFTFQLQSGKKPVTVEEGTPIILPMYGLQHDEKYFEQPEVFKPERFLGEEKEKLTKYTFFPFGEGPRACIGQRFGQLQTKIAVAYIVRNYDLTVNEKTVLPIKYDPLNSLVAPDGTLWLNFRKIR